MQTQTRPPTQSERIHASAQVWKAIAATRCDEEHFQKMCAQIAPFLKLNKGADAMSRLLGALVWEHVVEDVSNQRRVYKTKMSGFESVIPLDRLAEDTNIYFDADERACTFFDAIDLLLQAATSELFLETQGLGEKWYVRFLSTGRPMPPRLSPDQETERCEREIGSCEARLDEIEEEWEAADPKDVPRLTTLAASRASYSNALLEAERCKRWLKRQFAVTRDQLRRFGIPHVRVALSL